MIMKLNLMRCQHNRCVRAFCTRFIQFYDDYGQCTPLSKTNCTTFEIYESESLDKMHLMHLVELTFVGDVILFSSFPLSSLFLELQKFS